jgi:hypothetical protein
MNSSMCVSPSKTILQKQHFRFFILYCLLCPFAANKKLLLRYRLTVTFHDSILHSHSRESLKFTSQSDIFEFNIADMSCRVQGQCPTVFTKMRFWGRCIRSRSEPLLFVFCTKYVKQTQCTDLVSFFRPHVSSRIGYYSERSSMTFDVKGLYQNLSCDLHKISKVRSEHTRFILNRHSNVMCI